MLNRRLLHPFLEVLLFPADLNAEYPPEWPPLGSQNIATLDLTRSAIGIPLPPSPAYLFGGKADASFSLVPQKKVQQLRERLLQEEHVQNFLADLCSRDRLPSVPWFTPQRGIPFPKVVDIRLKLKQGDTVGRRKNYTYRQQAAEGKYSTSKPISQ